MTLWKNTILISLLSLFAGTSAIADETAVIEFAEHWATIKHQEPATSRQEKYLALLEKIIAARDSADMPALILWEGIVQSSLAGEIGGLSALKWVNRAKENFETVIAQAPETENGSAYTSLGVLYYSVPGWPISFGDKEKSLRYLKQGLSINPDGLDSNFFHGEYWLKAGDKSRALAAFKKALAAPPRRQRPVIDAGRRQDITQHLTTLDD